MLMPGRIAGDDVGGGLLAARYAKFQLSAVIPPPLLEVDETRLLERLKQAGSRPKRRRVDS